MRDSLVFRATAAVTLALLATACHANKYRYVRVPEPPGQALARVARDAEKAGWQRIPGTDGEYLVAAPKPVTDAETEPAAESGDETDEESRAEEVLRSWGALYLLARAFHAGQRGSLVELTTLRGKVLATGTHPLTRSSLELPLAGEPDVWFDNADRLRHALVWDFSCAAGIAVDSKYAAFRLDLGTQLGYRFRESGGSGDEPSPRRGLAGTVGMGLAMEHEGVSLRPSLSLWLDSQRTVELVPGTVIPQSRKRAIELSIAPLIGLGWERSGVEAGVAAHVWPLGAIFVRAGYDRKPRKQRTFFFGAQSDALTSGYLFLGLVAVGIGLALANADYGGIFDGWCHAGECEQ